MGIVEDLHNCNMGHHDLIEILRVRKQETDEVAKWCRICGAVVVDYEVDGRLMGCSVKMMGPQGNQLHQLYFEE